MFRIRYVLGFLNQCILQGGIPLKYKDHILKGSLEGFRECRIKPDWLLICLIENDVLALTLTDTGTYSDLLGM